MSNFEPKKILWRLAGKRRCRRAVCVGGDAKCVRTPTAGGQTIQNESRLWFVYNEGDFRNRVGNARAERM